MKVKKLIKVVIFLFSFLFFIKGIVFSSDAFKEEILEAVVTKILEEKEIEVLGKKQTYQRLELYVNSGSLAGKKIVVESGKIPLTILPKYKINDEVMVSYKRELNGKENFFITDFIRRNTLFWLFFFFVILSLIVARWQGLSSLLGMILTFLIIFKFILPEILKGSDPIFTVIIASLIIIPLTFYLSHGFNKKTTSAIFGTILSLMITGILANFFVYAGRLTGLASEEAGFLQVYKKGEINPISLLLAGIIIGALGILDDITISQAAIVQQLKETSQKISFAEIYSRAMSIGKDHIASMINTLILVYTGVSLPLLLLFINNPQPFSQVINYEIIAEEIIRTLVGSIGLILAVPITTIFSSILIGKSD